MLSAVDHWISQSNKSGSFKTRDKRILEENELFALGKELE
jgi:transposase